MLIANIIFWSGSVFAESPLFVGVLESFNKKELLSQVGQDSINPRVRIAFFKDKNNWQATKSNFDTFEELTNSIKYYPDRINWYVINNNNLLGNLTTVQYTPKLYRDVGVQKIVGDLPSKLQLPPTKNLQFPMMKMDHRPLITISKFNDSYNNFTDAEAWVASKPTPTEMKQLLKELHDKVIPGKSSNLNQDVRVVESYRSKNHGLILSTVIKNNSKGAYFSQIPYWFYITNSSIKFLETGMNLIDIADLDHDGRSEFIFMYSDPENVDQNSNGYILFYNDFKQSARFLWSNH